MVKALDRVLGERSGDQADSLRDWL